MSSITQALLALTLSGFTGKNTRFLLIPFEKKKEKSLVVKMKITNENFQISNEDEQLMICQLKWDDEKEQSIYDCKYHCEIGKENEKFNPFWGNCN